jgi:galactokinase
VIEEVRRAASARFGHAEETWSIARAPYRFCPLGAHTDHQGGIVTGLTLDRAVVFAFRPSDDERVDVSSLDEIEPATFRLGAVPPAVPGDWGNFVRGAALALEARAPLRRGVVGVLAGEMSPGGMSSSAAVGIASLLALETVNDLHVHPADNVELDRRIENDYVGLRNGILDPSVILLAKTGELLRVDCSSGERSSHALPLRHARAPLAFLAVYSGLRSSLVATSFNERVAECERAAALLLNAAGRGGEPRLRNVTRAEYEHHRPALDEVSKRRAEHFFGEQDRVAAGIEAWSRGDLPAFGRLVSSTCESSIRNYESGAPELVRLVSELGRLPGVHGARFSGAGFRGYAVALVDPASAAAITDEIRNRYLARHPEHAAAFHTHLCSFGARAGVISALR